jgi:diguanylate cyclase (GGDEF)-like protein/PAS domain S-box-containing protein
MLFVLLFASYQITVVYGAAPAPRLFVVPLLLGLLIGLLLSTLLALRQEMQETQRKFRAVADLAQEFVYIRRVDGSYEYVSPSCKALTGYGPEEFYARPSFMTTLVHPADQERWNRHVHQMDHHGNAEKLLVRIVTKGGEERWIQHLCSDMRDERGEILGVRSANLDITESVLHERELALAAVAFETHEPILITDRAARILRVNRAFCEVTGFTAEEVIGKTPAILKSGYHEAEFYAAMWRTLVAEGSWSGELWDRRKNGEIYPKFLTITAVRGVDGEVEHYVGTFSDISKRKAAEEEINRLAYFDPLTGLPNRRLLIDRLHQAMSAGERQASHGALLLIDLDHFKTLNDTRGHEVGDQLLIEVAQRLQSSIRTEDTVARLGGDEFVVMLENLGAEAAEAAAQSEAVAEKLLRALNQPFHLKGRYYENSSSIGATLFRGMAESVDDLLRHADVALYRAKEGGRAMARFFDPTMQEMLDARAALEADLRAALAQRQFSLHYQGQFDAAGRLLGAEVLLRWQHPERGLVPPGKFVPYAEECRLIVPIGRWVMQEACRQLHAWRDDPVASRLQLAVNVSALQFLDAGFVEDTLRLVRAHDIGPRRLKIELTESALIGSIDEAIAKMQTLKAAGIEFSLDDFGTGYSSLAYLQRLPLDQLKIDRSFVDAIASDSGAAIAQTIIGMGCNLGLDVIAEGVETAAQFEFLKRHGCHAYQGYLFARPQPADAFERILQDAAAAAVLPA